MMFDLAVRNTAQVLTLEPICGSIETEGPSLGNPYASMADLPTVDDAVELLINEALTRAKGNQSRAARTLGIDRSTLNRRIKKRMDEDSETDI
jgi:transcriptional regulator of acetoin/glycerol metabolism